MIYKVYVCVYEREREYRVIERKRGKVEVEGKGEGVFMLVLEGYCV
jgi:hypothetical protein